MTRRIPPTPEWESLQDAAARVGFSVATLRTLVSEGKLAAFRLSSKPKSQLRVRICDVDALLKPVIPQVVYDRD